MNESTITADLTADLTADIDNLSWDDWSPAEVCAIENGPDCAACEG